MDNECTNMENITLASLISNLNRNIEEGKDSVDTIDFRADYVSKNDFEPVQEYDVSVEKSDYGYNIQLQLRKEKCYE